MPNKKENLRLDEFVKQRISNYEPESTSPDWSKMENLLGVVAKSESHSGSSFSAPDFSGAAEIIKKLVSSYVFIAIIMLAAGATIFYFILKSPSTPTNNTTETQLQAIDTSAIDSVITNTTNSTEIQKEETAPKTLVNNDSLKNLKEKEEAEKIAQEEKEKELKAAKEEEEKKKAVEKEEEAQKEKKAKEERKKEEKKKEEKKKADKKEAEKKEKERKAKEDKKEPVKETLKKSNSPIGLGNLMRSVNIDSIKKQQEKQQEEQAKPANDTTQH